MHWSRKINLMPKWLNDNGILMYSRHNEGKSVVAERFLKTLKGNINKKMTATDKKNIILVVWMS